MINNNKKIKTSFRLSKNLLEIKNSTITNFSYYKLENKMKGLKIFIKTFKRSIKTTKHRKVNTKNSIALIPIGNK